ncbi:Uncharacterised protein [Turicibacter sanguinis]|nr:Uncharacterised protein [Turicibacter sanguinis]
MKAILEVVKVIICVVLFGYQEEKSECQRCR